MKKLATLVVASSAYLTASYGVDLAAAAKSSAVQVDPNLPHYEQTASEVSGNIKAVGSDTMINLMLLWAGGFKKYYPDVQVEIEGKGSSTAPQALIEGTANFGPMSRDWEGSEIDAFEAKFGYKPTTLATSLDMLSVYVNKDCPLASTIARTTRCHFFDDAQGGLSERHIALGRAGPNGQLD